MLAVLIENSGSKARLILKEQAKPRLLDQQLLVKVHAFALNRADLLQRFGHYPPPPGESSIPGLELAGEIVRVGRQVSQFKPGDNVYGLVGSGAYAQYCVVHESLATCIPSHWSFATAAAIPEALTTASATLDLARLAKGENFLIHAAGSGISTMAIQMGHIIGANISTTVSSDEKGRLAALLGADTIINYRNNDFASVLSAKSIDVIIDYLGGEAFAKHLHLLRERGRLVQIATMYGRNTNLDLLTLMQKRLQISGFILRAQSLVEKIGLWHNAHQRWFPELLAGNLRPIIDRIFPFAAIEDAQQHMLDNKHFGKIVITM